VAEQAPQPAHDDDGVIDMEQPAPMDEGQPADEHDSPI
jgi:hypothetical protein